MKRPWVECKYICIWAKGLFLACFLDTLQHWEKSGHKNVQIWGRLRPSNWGAVLLFSKCLGLGKTHMVYCYKATQQKENNKIEGKLSVFCLHFSTHFHKRNISFEENIFKNNEQVVAGYKNFSKFKPSFESKLIWRIVNT